MWDIYEDDDSFEKMAKAKVTNLMLSQKNEVLKILSFSIAADQGKRWCGGDICFYRRILFLFFLKC